MKRILIFLTLSFCVNIVFSQQTDTSAINSQIQSYISQINADSINSNIINLMKARDSKIDGEMNRWLYAKCKAIQMENIDSNLFRFKADIIGTTNKTDIYMINSFNGYYKVKVYDNMLSSTATILEIARIMKLKGYKPQSTIRFLILKFSMFDNYYIKELVNKKENIKFVITLNQAGYEPDTLKSKWNITTINYRNSFWTGFMTKDLREMFTLLNNTNHYDANYDKYCDFGFNCGFHLTNYPMITFFGGLDRYDTIYYKDINKEFCAEVGKLATALLIYTNDGSTKVKYDTLLVASTYPKIIKNKKLTVTTNAYTTDVNIYDVNGKTVLNNKFSYEKTFDTSTLPKGSYTVEIKAIKQIVKENIIIE